MDQRNDHGRAELDEIEHVLADVDAALERLDDGTYWTDEVTGAELDVAILATDPLARRNPRPTNG
jgi:RNA polymerase-binding transcription factor DksA